MLQLTITFQIRKRCQVIANQCAQLPIKDIATGELYKLLPQSQVSYIQGYAKFSYMSFADLSSISTKKARDTYLSRCCFINLTISEAPILLLNHLERNQTYEKLQAKTWLSNKTKSMSYKPGKWHSSLPIICHFILYYESQFC